MFFKRRYQEDIRKLEDNNEEYRVIKNKNKEILKENVIDKKEDKIQISNSSNIGYDDSYYKEVYNKNKYNEYEEKKKEIPWKIIIVIFFAILFIILLVYFLFFSDNKVGEKEYVELTTNLCVLAEKYYENNKEILDNKIPGNKAEVTLENLFEEGLIKTEKIEDPRYEKSIFGKENYNRYLSLDSYLSIVVANNGSIYCDGFTNRAS